MSIPPSRSAALHRPGFAFGGWAMLLFLVLIGVCIVNSYLKWAALPPASSIAPSKRPYYAGVQVGIWAVPVIVPLVMLGVAWLVGKLVSLMFGKSDDAGNIGASIILVAVIALFGYGIYDSSTATPPPATTTAVVPPSAADTLAAENAEAMRRQVENAHKILDENSERMRQQAEAARQAAQRNLDTLRETARHPGSPAAPSAPPAPAAPPSPAAAAPEATPANPPALGPTNPAIRPVIDAFEKELNAQIDTLLAATAKTIPDLQRTPPHDVARIKSRKADIESLRAAAEALKQPLDTASDMLTAKLEAAGVSRSDARIAAMRWAGFDYKATPRSFGVDAVTRLCDKAREECEYLTDNLGKWTLDSKGEVKCNDFQTKAKINSLRFFVKAEADRRTQTEDQIRGR